MDYLKSFPALEGLVDLANRDDIDINPTLLRVLTDLYVTKPKHTREEERQYSELALRLIDVVDVSVRHRLAQRLAAYPAAPADVLRRLARDVIAVAEPILRQSRVLSATELNSIVRESGRGHAAALAAREGGKTAEAPACEPDEALFAGKAATAHELNQLFLTANATERKLILLNLDFAPFAPANPLAETLAREAVRRLEVAAFAHHIESFARELARTLAISPEQARQLVMDTGGEPLVAAAKALDMPSEVFQRVLLCLNPVIGQSVQRVYDLADLYAALKPDAALRMLAIWQAMAGKPQAATHRSQYVGSNTSPRPSAVPAPRRLPAAKPFDRRSSGSRS